MNQSSCALRVRWSPPRGYLVSLLLSSLAVLAGCGSGSSSGSSAAAPAPQAPAPATTATLSGLAPTSLSFDLSAGSSDVASLAFTNSGDANLTYSFASNDTWLQVPAAGSLAPGASTNVSVTATCGAVALNGSITLSTNDPNSPTVNVPADANCTPQAAAEIARVTINQAARAYDSDQSAQPSIGLIAGRETLVRAFVTTVNGGAASAAPEARVRISSPSGTQIVGMQAPAQISATPGAESILGANYFAVIPGSAMVANAEISVEVGPVGDFVSFPEAAPLAINPVDAGVLEVTFVPVTFQGQTPSIDIDDSMRESLQVLPIGDLDVEVRAPYVFSGAYDLDQLLTEMMDLRNLDGSSRLYHGVIIPPSGSTSNTAGIGFVGFPVSVSIDLGGSQFVIAHELGHNLDLGHAPGCGSPNPDPDFPNATGNISDWGYDVHADALVAPSAALFDFMSYCGDLWTSGYHFNKAIEHRDQSPIGFRVLPSQGLSISGRISNAEVSEVRMLPTEHHVARISQSDDTPFLMRAWDRAGNLLLEQAFAGHLVEDQAEPYTRFAISAPLPAAPIYHYEIYAGAALIYERTLDDVNAEQRRVDIDAQGSQTSLAWQPHAGEALVVRDAQRRVVAVDRTGSLQMSTATQALELELVRANTQRERIEMTDHARSRDIYFRAQ